MFLARNMRPTLPQRWLASSSVAEKPRDSVASRSMFGTAPADRKSTRLNSSHLVISYAVFCLKKKNLSGDDLYDAARLTSLPPAFLHPALLLQDLASRRATLSAAPECPHTPLLQRPPTTGSHQ